MVEAYAKIGNGLATLQIGDPGQAIPLAALLDDNVVVADDNDGLGWVDILVNFHRGVAVGVIERQHVDAGLQQLVIGICQRDHLLRSDIKADARGIAALPDQILLRIGYAVVAPGVILIFTGEQEDLLQWQAIEPRFERTDIAVEGTNARLGIGAKVGKAFNAQADKGAVVAGGKAEAVGFA